MPVRHADSEADLPSREMLLSMSGLAFMQAMRDGIIVHPGRSTATARAELRAEDGKLYATGTTTCIILG